MSGTWSVRSLRWGEMGFVASLCPRARVLWSYGSEEGWSLAIFSFTCSQFHLGHLYLIWKLYGTKLLLFSSLELLRNCKNNKMQCIFWRKKCFSSVSLSLIRWKSLNKFFADESNMCLDYQTVSEQNCSQFVWLQHGWLLGRSPAAIGQTQHIPKHL